MNSTAAPKTSQQTSQRDKPTGSGFGVWGNTDQNFSKFTFNPLSPRRPPADPSIHPHQSQRPPPMKPPHTTPGRFLSFAATLALVSPLAAQPPASTPTVTTPAATANPAAAVAPPPASAADRQGRDPQAARGGRAGTASPQILRQGRRAPARSDQRHCGRLGTARSRRSPRRHESKL